MDGYQTDAMQTNLKGSKFQNGVHISVQNRLCTAIIEVQLLWL